MEVYQPIYPVNQQIVSGEPVVSRTKEYYKTKVWIDFRVRVRTDKI